MDAGLGDTGAESWSWIMGQLAAKALTVVYDRAGLGSSQAGPEPRITEEIVTELHTLLINGGFAPPFILVGHSIGGPHIRAYARRYPAEVAGMVIVDGRHENFDAAFFQRYPAEYEATLQSLDSHFSAFSNGIQREWAGVRELLPSLGVLDPHPDVPAMILTAGMGWTSSNWFGLDQSIVDDLKSMWIASHEDLAESFTRGSQLTVGNAGHYIQIDSPQIVIDAILGVLDEARIGLSSPPVGQIEMMPAEGVVPIQVSLDASASQDPSGSPIASYIWDFGDGQTGQGLTIEHMYREAGRYVVSLLTNSASGLWSTTRRTFAANPAVGDTAPWIGAEVGTFDFATGARREGDCLVLSAAGRGMRGSKDELLFAFQEVRGDFILTADVPDFLNSGHVGEAGLLCRAGSEVGDASAGVFLLKSQESTVTSFRYRSKANASSITRTTPAETTKKLRLAREGQWLIGSLLQAANPDAWTEFKRVELGLGEKALVGFSTSGADGPRLVQARLCGIELVQPGWFVRGELNGDASLDIGDPISLLWVLFGSEGHQIDCMKSGDTDDSGTVDLTDAIALLTYLFLSGQAPPEPFKVCGNDPTPDDLSCESFPSCA